MKARYLIGSIVLLMLGLPLLALVALRLSARRPAHLGVARGRLAPCPTSPNCVSTQAPEADAVHAIAPLEFTGTTAEARARLAAVIAQLPRAKVITQDEHYWHVEFTSGLLRFVDDVEFWIDAERHQIQFRSASRVGHSDLGVNRRRMERIRQLFRDA